jgi:hypothetical protein
MHLIAVLQTKLYSQTDNHSDTTARANLKIHNYSEIFDTHISTIDRISK